MRNKILKNLKHTTTREESIKRLIQLTRIWDSGLWIQNSSQSYANGCLFECCGKSQMKNQNRTHLPTLIPNALRMKNKLFKWNSMTWQPPRSTLYTPCLIQGNIHISENTHVHLRICKDPERSTLVCAVGVLNYQPIWDVAQITVSLNLFLLKIRNL